MAGKTAPDTKAILAAIKRKDLPALKKALERNSAPPSGQAVVAAAGLAWLPGLKLLRANGGDLNASFRNYRALHALIQEDPHKSGVSTPERIAVLQWLLDNGADTEQMAAWPSARAVIVAAFTGELRYVRTLLDAGAKRDVFTAAALGDARRLGKLLTQDAALATARDGGLLTALQCAGGSRLGRSDTKIASGLVECARLLVDAGADVDARTRSWGHDVAVSYFVIRSGQIDMLRFLLNRGMNPTDAISPAAWDRREDMLDLLVAHGADVAAARADYRPVLNELVRWGQFEAARLLLRKGGDPNVPNADGCTAMHQAVSRGNVRMLQDLIAAGGDVTRPDERGRTPRGVAKKKGRHDLVRACSKS